MLTKNKPVAIILCLGNLGVSMFYWSDIAYGLFNPFGLQFPLIGSDITGVPNYKLLLSYRAIYLLLSIAFAMGVMILYPRIGNKGNSKLQLVVCFTVFLISIGIGYSCLRIEDSWWERHVNYGEIFSRYALVPTIDIEKTHLKIYHNGDQLDVMAKLMC